MRKLIFLLLVLCGIEAVQAAAISESRALEIARGFFQTGGSRLAPGKEGKNTLTLAFAGKSYYAFNRGVSGGFVIVAADDRARGVLGYTDRGSFVHGSLPASLRYWLSRYERQIEWASQRPAGNTYRLAGAKVSRTPVAPIVSAEWDQHEPYNDKCPEDNGTRCPTGCVATAIAQIMYTNKWPEKGTGSISYEWVVNDVSKGTLSADFSQSSYDWESMADTYGGESSEAARDAVATLLRDVGYAVQMQYTSSTSGATTFKAMEALHNYFGYDKGVAYYSADFYTADEWEEMCYSELAAGRAFYLSGSNDAAGHAFVCDGYENGYFHINWGWGGLSNGYFLLDALDPEVQGTGGGSAGYDQNLASIFGIRQPQEGSSYIPIFYCRSEFDVSPKTATQSTQVTFTGYCYNFSVLTYNANPGIKVVDADGNATYIASSAKIEMSPLYGYGSFQMRLAGFPTEEGTYTVTPALHDEDTGIWYDIPVMQSCTRRYLIATVSGSEITFENPTDAEDYITVSNVSRQEKGYAGETYTLTATLSNTGKSDYSGRVALGLLKPNTSSIIAMSSWSQVELTAGASCGQSFTLTLPGEVGEYELVVFSESGKGLSGRMSLTVEGSATGAPAFELAGPIEVESSSSVDPANFKLTANVSCTSGSYDGALFALVFPEGDSPDYLEYLYNPSFSISMGETREVEISGTLNKVEEGGSYDVSVWYSGTDGYVYKISSADFPAQTTFTVARTSGVGDAVSPSGPHDIQIFNVSGVCVSRQRGEKADITALAPGIYVIKEGDTVRKVLKK